ncbi:MAG: ASPIC/UnbV domain-containing protein [Saprospiraceae bacterium]
MINQGNENHWLQLQLKGVHSNAAAIGARVKVKARINGQEIWQLREVSSQSGYAGQNSLRVHFGLGDAVLADSLVIYWPAGGVQTYSELTADQLLIVHEDIANWTVQATPSTRLNFKVFPNPVSVGMDSLQLQLENQLGQRSGTVTCYNTVGQLMGEWSVECLPGISHIQLPFTGRPLAPGMYRIVLELTDRQLSKNIIVK